MQHWVAARRAGARVYCAGGACRTGQPVVAWSEREARGRRAEILTGSRVEYAAQTDEELVNLIGQRDVHALETLYNRHARAVYSLSLKMLGEPAAAEEIVQECFLKLWRQPELYQAGRGKL